MAEVIPVLNVKWISIRLQKQCKHTNRKSFASLNDRTFWFSSECFTASSQKTSHTHTHTHTRTWMHKHQWCLLLLVSGHRLKKNNPDCSHPHQDLGPIDTQFWWSCVPFILYDATDKPAIVFPPNSSLKSVQNTNVWTSASELQGHHVLAEVSSHVVYRVKACYALSVP